MAVSYYLEMERIIDNRWTFLFWMNFSSVYVCAITFKCSFLSVIFITIKSLWCFYCTFSRAVFGWSTDEPSHKIKTKHPLISSVVLSIPFKMQRFHLTFFGYCCLENCPMCSFHIFKSQKIGFSCPHMPRAVLLLSPRNFSESKWFYETQRATEITHRYVYIATVQTKYVFYLSVSSGNENEREEKKPRLIHLQNKTNSWRTTTPGAAITKTPTIMLTEQAVWEGHHNAVIT